MRVSKEFQIGLLAVVALSALYFGFDFIKGNDFFSSSHTYHVFYENVDGLTVSNPVSINGYRVGRVSGIKMIPENKNKLKISIAVDKNVEIKEGTEAMLADAGLMGGKTIILNLSASGKVLQHGDTLKAVLEKGMIDMLGAKGMPMLEDVDSVLLKVNGLAAGFEGSGADAKAMMLATTATIANINAMLLANQQNLNKITGNMALLTASLVETEKSIKPLMAKLDKVADNAGSIEMKKIAENANQAIEGLNKTIADINNAQGSLGKLMKSDSLYNGINKATGDLDKLFIDMKERPSRYVHFSVFGGDKEEKKKKKEPSK